MVEEKRFKIVYEHGLFGRTYAYVYVPCEGQTEEDLEEILERIRYSVENYTSISVYEE